MAQQDVRPGSCEGLFTTVARLVRESHLALVRATGSETLTLVVAVSSLDAGMVVIAVIVRPCASTALTSVNSWVMVDPLANVFTVETSYSAM
jgi:hypothetical protein